MEKYRIGDFIRLKDVSKYEINRIKGGEVNVFEISGIDTIFVELKECDSLVPVEEIQPIKINGVDDKDIYYDPVISASYVMPGEPTPTRYTNYSYYFDTFLYSFMDGVNFQGIIRKRGCRYVHEVQEFLREIHQPTALKIDTY
jgi:hypothetical protein